MTDNSLIFRIHNRIEAEHHGDLDAVVTTYVRTFDPHGVFLPAGVRCGLDYATANGIRNWIVDVSGEEDTMSDKDREWEKSDEFRQLFRESSVRNIVFLVTPDDAAGDTTWAVDFAKKLGPDFSCYVTDSMDETRITLENNSLRSPS